MRKRVIFTQGGKGGVGKTTIAASLVEWFQDRKIPLRILDFDVENEEASGLSCFIPEAEKFNVHREGSLDAVLDILDDKKCNTLLIDQAAASGEPTFRWFEDMADAALVERLCFTSIGVVTGDPGSVQAVLKWADRLQDNVDYLIALNQLGDPTEEFNSWVSDTAVMEFQDAFDPAVITVKNRLAEFEELLRATGQTLGQVAAGNGKGKLGSSRWKIRATGYKRALDDAFDSVESFLTPLHDHAENY